MDKMCQYAQGPAFYLDRVNCGEYEGILGKNTGEVKKENQQISGSGVHN